MEKNTNHELNVVVVVAAIMADRAPTLLTLALSLKRCVSSDARRNFRAYCAGAGDNIEVSSVIGAVREVTTPPIIVKDLVLKPFVPTIDEGDDLKEDCHRATGCKEDIVHHIYCLYSSLF